MGDVKGAQGARPGTVVLSSKPAHQRKYTPISQTIVKNLLIKSKTLYPVSEGYCGD